VLALCLEVIARNLNELRIYQTALVGSKSISALVNRRGFRKDFKLRNQLSDASDSTCSNIAEGFGQSDRKFVQHLYIARGSANEVCARLTVARQRDYITSEQFTETIGLFETVGKMTTRLIQYLERSERRRLDQ
jgi:four helix bundle protein